MAALTGDSTVMLGSTTSLTCMVTLPLFNSYSSIPITVTVGLLHGNTVMTNSTPSGSGAVRTSVFTFFSVGVSNVGQYQCRATVTTTASNVVNSAAVNSNSVSLTVQGKLSCM